MTARHVAVTGAGRGIGKAIAEYFARDGWVVWALVRDEAQVSALKALGDVRYVPFDASTEKGVLDAANALSGQPVWGLVNNAGIAHSAALARTSTEDFERIQQVNVTAPFLLCRELMPAMAASGGGRVVNIASTAARKGFKYTVAYCASKHALLGLTRALAVEFASKAVTVNAVCPGWTDTDMMRGSVQRISESTGRSENEARAALEQMTPLGRAVRPDEVAQVVHFLIDAEASAAITGSSYDIDGGETV